MESWAWWRKLQSLGEVVRTSLATSVSSRSFPLGTEGQSRAVGLRTLVWAARVSDSWISILVVARRCAQKSVENKRCDLNRGRNRHGGGYSWASEKLFPWFFGIFFPLFPLPSFLSFRQPVTSTKKLSPSFERLNRERCSRKLLPDSISQFMLDCFQVSSGNFFGLLVRLSPSCGDDSLVAVFCDGGGGWRRWWWKKLLHGIREGWS